MQILVSDDGEFVEFEEVPDDDCELEPDGSGFWYLAAEGEDEEEFYEFEDVAVEADDES